MRLMVIRRDPVKPAYSTYPYLRAHGFEPCADPVEGLEKQAHRRAENWHHLWHHRQMGFYAAEVQTLQDGFGRDQVGVFLHDDPSSDCTTTVGRLLRLLGLPYDPAEGKNVPRVNASGTPRSALPHMAILAATHDEVGRRTVRNRTSSRFRERVPHSFLHGSAVPPAVEETLRSAYDEDLTEISTLISGDVPPWQSEARLSEDPR
jgi:hypothetical protein